MIHLCNLNPLLFACEGQTLSIVSVIVQVSSCKHVFEFRVTRKMERNLEQRVVIKFLMKSGESSMGIFGKLIRVYGNETINFRFRITTMLPHIQPF